MTEIYQPFCPVCFTSHGTKAEHDPAKKWYSFNRHNFWLDVQNSDPDKPFGTILESQGRGTLRMKGYFGPAEDPTGSFPLIRARLLAAVHEWIEKGWLTKEEVGLMVAESAQGAPLVLQAPATSSPASPRRRRKT
jgi:hypothetical protein